MISDFIKRYQGWLAMAGAMASMGIALPVLHIAMPQDQPADSPYLRNDPEKIVLSDNDDRVPCGECHTLEYDTWKSTPHSEGFDTMHRSAQAQSILERMEFRLAKRESLCLRCHYTAQIVDDQARAIAGVSCESCHGAGRDWVNVHNDYGGATHETETSAHKLQRIQASMDGGMLRPSDNVYAVAANCFECHTVPSERLINVGRHPSGSQFELVEWSDKIRHNVLAAQWTGDETNREQSPNRKRQLYVVGRLLDYEYSLRGAAEATAPGQFAKAMERRVAAAVRELEKIARVITIEEVNQVLSLHKNVRLTPNNGDALLVAAEQVRALGQRFGTTNPPATWEALDLLIEGGVPPEPEPVETPPEEAPENVELPADETGPESSTPTPIISEVVGIKRQRPAWFPDEAYEVIVPGCNCHATAEDWLFEDVHGRSADPILNSSRRAVQIASLYGLSASQMKQGSQICMNCHGTIESGASGGQVFESVGCESCHGPSSGYLQPHKRGQGFQNGLKDLKETDVRAANCARCHHITDERLLASGHSSGEGYDILAGNASIKHWPDPDLDRPPAAEMDAGALSAAFDQIKRDRLIPHVTVVTPPPAPSPEVATVEGPPQSSATNEEPSTTSIPPAPPPVRPLPPVPERTHTNVILPPAPALSDSATTEEILLHVKTRLEQLYQALGRNE